MGEDGKNQIEEKKPNIILIVLDTMREDGIGVYNSQACTPNIDKFAEEGTVYRNVISPSSWTLPSHVSFLTGLYPMEHGVNLSSFLDHNLLTNGRLQKRYLPAKLKTEGYNTVGISANNVVSPEYGFDYGYDLFANIPYNPTSIPNKLREQVNGFGPTLKSASINMLRTGHLLLLAKSITVLLKDQKRRRKAQFPLIKGCDRIYSHLQNLSLTSPFFLFVNLMEMHEPYPGKGSIFSPYIDISEQDKLRDYFGVKKIRRERKAAILSSYYRESETLDEYFGKLVTHLKKHNLYENSLIVVISDHGQDLGENDLLYHGHFLYDEMVRVPAIIKYPENFNRQDGKTTTSMRSLVDIYSVILSFARGSGSEYTESEFVFSEVYDASNDPSWKQLDNAIFHKDTKRFDRLKSPKKAVFYQGNKLVVKGDSGDILEFKVSDCANVLTDAERIARSMLNELEIFRGNQDFVLPDKTNLNGLGKL